MIKLNFSTVLIAAALVALLLAAFTLAREQHKLPLLALDLTEHLFGIILAIFVFERVVAWQEERRWLAAKKWLYMILLETIDDLLKQLIPATVPGEGEEPTSVYEVTGERVRFGEAVAYGLLRLLFSPDDKELQSHVLWYAMELEPLRYASLTKAALSNAREQIRDTFGSSARLMEADITAMLMNFEQAIVAATGHMDSAINMRDERVEEASRLDDEGSAAHRTEEADHQLAFTTSIIVESIISAAMKPKAWLEAQLHARDAGPALEYLQVSGPRR